ncbi:hypothetical protein SISNIDRAFT_551403, partial [Sistotremastrum niveocremeum HHB9708]
MTTRTLDNDVNGAAKRTAQAPVPSTRLYSVTDPNIQKKRRQLGPKSSGVTVVSFTAPRRVNPLKFSRVTEDPNPVPRDGDETQSRRPFQYADADVILRSKDDVSFRVHRLILTLASEKFKELLQNPPSGSKRRRIEHGSGSETESYTSIPIISIDESSKSTSDLLSYLYPVRRPVINSLRALCTQIYLVDRWDLQAARFELTERLTDPSLIAEDPVYAYDIARKLDLPSVRRVALRALYELPFEGDKKYFMDKSLSLTAGDLQQIIAWKKRHFEDVHSLIKSYRYQNGPTGTSCEFCAVGKWCWWDHFQDLVRGCSKPLTDDVLKCTINIAARICKQSPLEVYNGVESILGDMREKIASLPGEYKGIVGLS